MTALDPTIERVLRDGLRREGWPGAAHRHFADVGGLTRGGITATNWGDWRGLGRPATADELNVITDAEALAFYHERYARRFEAVLDPSLRALLIDWSFTSWFDDPTKALQESLGASGLYTGRIDGMLGPQTAAALAADRDPRRTFRDVFNARVRFYLALAFDREARIFLRSHPSTQLHFCAGWIHRCLEFTP